MGKKIFEKLTSRKFWAALLSFITAMCSAFAVEESTAAQITLIIGGIGAMCVYIFAEGKIDAARITVAENDIFAEDLYGFGSEISDIGSEKNKIGDNDKYKEI